MNNKLKLAGYSFLLLLALVNFSLAILQLFPELLPPDPKFLDLVERVHNTRDNISAWISIPVVGAYLLAAGLFIYFGKKRRSA